MAKPAIVFVCADCGAETLKWQGQCPQCSQWNTLEQRSVVRRPSTLAAALPRRPQLTELAAGSLPRLSTGMAELDRVLGGGLIPGSVTLLGGEPGIGKSTLAAAACQPRGPSHPHAVPVGRGIRRPDRRACAAPGSVGPNLRVVADTDLEAMLARAREEASGC